MLQDPPEPDRIGPEGLTPQFLLLRRTEIGRYVP